MEGLTGVRGLIDLTLLKLGKAVRGAVIRPKQVWCSDCLVGFAKHDSGIYQPLLWSMRDVNACPTHQSKLETQCPSCGKSHRPLTRYRWDGCCPQCDTPLAGTSQPADLWELRVAQRAAEALINLQALHCPIDRSCFASNMRRLCASFSGGNLSELARQIQIHHSNIRDWMSEKQVPSLSSLLRLSAVFEVPVLGWLIQSIDLSPRSFFGVRPATAKPRLRRCDSLAVRQELDTLVKEHQFPPPSFATICKKLGTEQTFVARKFPDHARALIDRRKQYLAIKQQMRRQFTKLVVKSTFNRLLCDGLRPTWRKMAKCLPEGIALREQCALEEFKKLRSELAAEFHAVQTAKASEAASTGTTGKNKVAAAVLDP